MLVAYNYANETVPGYGHSRIFVIILNFEECRLLGCYAVWLL
jgi:hypothetical protein